MTDVFPFAVSIVEAVKITGIGRSSLYSAIAAGMLKTRKAGRRTLIEVSELRRYIESLPVSGRSKDAA
jgi:excisionase family DNA binding protein